MQSLVSRRLVSLICVSVTLGVASGACGGGSGHAVGSVQGVSGSTQAKGGSGCHKYIHGVFGRILPETSDLNCAAIDDLTFAVPSEPSVEYVQGESPRLLWKCRLYGEQEAPPLLLRCQHHRRHFSIVKKN